MSFLKEKGDPCQNPRLIWTAVGLTPNSLPRSLNHNHRPPAARRRAKVVHTEPLVALRNFRLKRLTNTGKDEPTSVPDTPHQDRRHLNQRSGDDIRNDEWPGAVDGLGSAVHELQPIRQTIQTSMLSCHSQRVSINVEADRARHAHHQRRQREHPGTSANVKDAAGYRSSNRFLDRLTAQCRGWMMSGSEGCGVRPSKSARWSVTPRRHDQNSSDMNRTRIQ